MLGSFKLKFTLNASREKDKNKMDLGTLFQIQNILIYGLLIAGLTVRKKRQLHVKIMGSMILWELLLVAQIELSRGAVAKAEQVQKIPALLTFHISMALSSVILYFCLIYFGKRLLKGDNSVRPVHKRLGWLCTTTRSLTFITSFFTVA
jgi:hypothetical protein